MEWNENVRRVRSWLNFDMVLVPEVQKLGLQKVKENIEGWLRQ